MPDAVPPARVALLGANSAVGRAILRLADRVGTSMVACVRSERAERELPVLPADARVERIDYGSPDSLRRAFEGVGAVIHLPGLLIERRDSTYAQANLETTRAALEGAQGIAKKMVLVSAVGADPASRNRYYRTKGEAEQLVRESGLEHTIVRAPLVIGEGTEGEAALVRYLSQSRVRLVGGGRSRQQPLDAADLARGALAAARTGIATGRTLDLVGPESLPYAQLIERAALLAGRKVRVAALPVPVALLRALLRVRRAVVGHGFSADALDVILDEHALDPKIAATALGTELTPLDATLEEMISRNDLRPGTAHE